MLNSSLTALAFSLLVQRHRVFSPRIYPSWTLETNPDFVVLSHTAGLDNTPIWSDLGGVFSAKEATMNVQIKMTSADNFIFWLMDW
jgi:hypothetical protein